MLSNKENKIYNPNSKIENTIDSIKTYNNTIVDTIHKHTIEIQTYDKMYEKEVIRINNMPIDSSVIFLHNYIRQYSNKSDSI